MHFYRPLGRISALTFDLDDTLYDNHPVVARTEQEVLAFIQSYHPALSSLQNSDPQRLRQAARDAESEIHHDAAQWCHHAVECVMLEAGSSAAEARMRVSTMMMNFTRWRSRIKVPQTTHGTLKALAREWPLAMIASSDTQLELFGLGDYFEFVLRAGPDGQSESFSDMYMLATEKLKMPMGEILHVGDDLIADVADVIRCGMQTCWIKPESANLM